MPSANHANLCHLSLPVAATVVGAALTMAMVDVGIKPNAPEPDSRAPVGPGRFTTIEIRSARAETAHLGINDSGEMAGGYDDGKGDRGFMRDRRGRVTTIDIPGARGTAPRRSTTVARSRASTAIRAPDTQDPDAPEHGFLLERGKLTRIDVPAAVQTRAAGLNNRGRWSASTPTSTACSTASCGTREGSPRSMPPRCRDIRRRHQHRGQIVGAYSEGGTTAQGFLLSGGVFTKFEAPGVPLTLPFDINNRAQMVGTTISDPDGTTSTAVAKSWASTARPATLARSILRAVTFWATAPPP
jgi:hypothetical protein